MDWTGDRYKLSSSALYTQVDIERLHRKGLTRTELQQLRLSRQGTQAPFWLDSLPVFDTIGTNNSLLPQAIPLKNHWHEVVSIASCIAHLPQAVISSTSNSPASHQASTVRKDWLSLIPIAGTIAHLPKGKASNLPKVATQTKKEARQISKRLSKVLKVLHKQPPWNNRDTILDLAALLPILDAVSMTNVRTSDSEPNITPPPALVNVNWVENWERSEQQWTSVSRHPSRSLAQEDVSFELVKPSIQTAAPMSNIPDSKFVRWLKDKEAKRQGQDRWQEIEQLADETKTEEHEKGEISLPSLTNQNKLSKKERKKKKKELKKILKQSLKMEEIIVSETLAQLMYDQGYVEKAVEMYEKLSLLFPEKSTYFAEILKRIEES